MRHRPPLPPAAGAAPTARFPAPLRGSSPLGLLAMLAMLAGCAGSPAGAPAGSAQAAAATELAAAPAFLNADPRRVAGDADPRWWQRFDDPALDELVTAALAANHDVRIALARVDLARAGTDLATARLLPTLNAVAAHASARTGYAADERQRLPDTAVRRAGLDASWELDLFGAARAARGAAVADLQAVEHARRGAQLAVIAEVARQVFTLRGAQARAALVDALIASQQQTLRLTELRRAAGQASDFDTDRAAAELLATQAARPPLQTLIGATLNRLATLTGRAPGAWRVRLETPAPQALPPPVAPGQPAALLQRRPDLLAAEAQLRAAGRRGDEARASRFPRLLLSALFGSQWTEWNALDFGRARFATVGATLAMPLFAGGRIQAGIDAANAREREALAVYERALLQALEDVEDALLAQRHEAARAQDLDQSVSARERALARARALYREGQADLLVVLDVERGLLAAQLDRTTNRTDQLLATVALYRALGGGWQVAEPAPAARAS